MTPARSFERDFFGPPPRARRLAKLVTHGRDGRRVRISWRVGVGRGIRGAVSYTHLTLPTNREV